MGEPSVTSKPLDVAIIGGGIVGVITALGLLRRGAHVTIYERSPSWPENGAAFAFTGVARQCMQSLDPTIVEALGRVARRSPAETIRYWDGFNPRTKEAAQQEETALLFETPEKDLAFWGTLRTPFLYELAAALPKEGDVVQFGKRLTGYVDDWEEGSDKVLLSFADGTTAEADVVIACDGVHSTTRALLLGAHPAAKAKYAHQMVYRALMPMDGALAAFGTTKASVNCFHLGPDAHMVSFPIMNGAAFNVYLFVHDPDEWQDTRNSEKPSSRDEVQDALQSWGPHVTELLMHLPDKVSKWAIFDMADHPAATYASGRVALAGDAAHASSPFHGAGAGMGVEDALVICELLAGGLGAGPDGVPPGQLAAALRAYSDVRIPRTQWLVESSRQMGDMYQWRYGPTGSDPARIKDEFLRRQRKIWDFDPEDMVQGARGELEKQLGALSSRGNVQSSH